MAAFYPTIPSNHPDHIFRSVFQLSSLDSTSQQRRSQDSSSAWHLVTSWLDPESDRTQTPATIEGLDNALSDLLRYRETASSLVCIHPPEPHFKLPVPMLIHLRSTGGQVPPMNISNVLCCLPCLPYGNLSV